MRRWLLPLLPLMMTAAPPVMALAPMGPATFLKPPAADPSRFHYNLQPREIAPNTWVMEGAVEDFSKSNGCNIINTGFVLTPKGVVVINTGPSLRYGQQQLEAIRRITQAPVWKVLNLNLHPDYFFGNQAYAPETLSATARTAEGIRSQGKAFEDNMYRLCGDWMRDTALQAPTALVQPGPLDTGAPAPTWQLIEMAGHTDSDLMLFEPTLKVLFAGGLIFLNRAPTTPHADLPRWIKSLDELERMRPAVVVPSHGPMHHGGQAILQTRRYLQWLHDRLQNAASSGLEMTEVLALPIPEEFAGMAAVKEEYERSIFHLYPTYERAVLRSR